MSNSSGRSQTRSSRFAGAEQQQHLVALGHLLAVQLDRPGERARHELRRTFVAEDLLDRVGDAAGSATTLRALAREPLQREQAVGEQLRGGLVAGDDQQEAGSPTTWSSSSASAPAPGAAQRGGEIVGRAARGDRGAPVGDEVAEVLVEMGRGDDAGGRDVGNAFVAVEQRVRPDAELLLVVRRAHRACARSRPSGAAPRSRRRDRPRRSRRARSRNSLASTRISGSRSATRRGVNARLTSRRRSVWSGGSVVSSIGSGLSCSSVMP